MLIATYLLVSSLRVGSATHSDVLLAGPHEWIETAKMIRNGGLSALGCAIAGGLLMGLNSEKEGRFEAVTMGAFLGVVIGGLLGIFAVGPVLE